MCPLLNALKMETFNEAWPICPKTMAVVGAGGCIVAFRSVNTIDTPFIGGELGSYPLYLRCHLHNGLLFNGRHYSVSVNPQFLSLEVNKY